MLKIRTLGDDVGRDEVSLFAIIIIGRITIGAKSNVISLNKRDNINKLEQNEIGDVFK
jgi:hypothetical protein